MALTVIVRSGDLQTPPRITFDAPRVVIGRGESCEVWLPDPSVSHRHASLRQRGAEWVVLDEGSTNGTFVGNARLDTAAPRVLSSGDLIRIGRIWLEVRIEHAVPTPNAGDATKEIALALVSEALAAQGEVVTAMVRVVEGPDAGREVAITEVGRRYVAGRGKEVDLCLDDDDASRRHVEILRRGDQIWVRDLGSKNGTKLGALSLRPEVETPWPRGDHVIIGGDHLAYTDPIADALDELEHAADEHVRAGETIDPPVGAKVPEPTPATPAAPADLATEQRRGGPVAAMPKAERERAKRSRSARRGWTAPDYAVAVVAIVVLASSLLGMWWLFRG